MFWICCTVPSNFEEIKKDPQRIKKIKPSINKYNLEEINCPWEEVDWKKTEKNNGTIALNVLYARKQKIYPSYVSKHKPNREKQVILLIISNRDKRKDKSEGRQQQWHYPAMKKLSTLLRRITSKHHGECYCLNCLHSFATENKEYAKIKLFVTL